MTNLNETSGTPTITSLKDVTTHVAKLVLPMSYAWDHKPHKSCIIPYRATQCSDRVYNALTSCGSIYENVRAYEGTYKVVINTSSGGVGFITIPTSWVVCDINILSEPEIGVIIDPINGMYPPDNLLCITSKFQCDIDYDLYRIMGSWNRYIYDVYDNIPTVRRDDQNYAPVIPGRTVISSKLPIYHKYDAKIDITSRFKDQ